MILRILDYVDHMGPTEFMFWIAGVLLLYLGLDFWRLVKRRQPTDADVLKMATEVFFQDDPTKGLAEADPSAKPGDTHR